MTDTPGLKIIGAGFGRTGTLSLKAALEEIGFNPCYHMTEVFNKPEHFALWEAAADGKPMNWDKVFTGYQATVDWPACTFYKELMQTYPDAKVLLTVRNPNTWYESVKSTIYQTRRISQSPLASLFFFVLKSLNPSIRGIASMTKKLIWDGTFHDKFEDKDYAISIYKQHIEEVKKYVPPEKLLVYEVKEGWEPLCAFLGVNVPKDKPFPHLNDRANFAGNRIWLRYRGRIVNAALLSASLLALLIILLRQRKHIRHQE